MIYFIQDRPTSAIKIGYAIDPRERLTSLQIGNPSPLTLLATMPGSRVGEAKLHRRFAPYRLTGEWFRPSSEILSFIKSIPYGDTHVGKFANGDVVRLLVRSISGWKGIGRVIFVDDRGGVDLQKISPPGESADDVVTCCEYEVRRLRNPRKYDDVPCLLPDWLCGDVS